MSQFEHKHCARMHRALLFLLWVHVPVLAGITEFFHTSMTEALLIGSAICLGPTVAFLVKPSRRITSYLLAFSFACMSGLLIHLGRGMIEMHFHVFVMIGVLISLASPVSLVINAGTIAVHHLAFFFLLPSSVFNYEASFGIVLVHAVFVVIETVPACLVAFKFNRSVKAQAIVSERLVGTSGDLFETVSKLNASADDLASGSQEQIRSIGEISSAMEEISGMSETGLERSREARDISQSSQTSSLEGSARMEELADAMKDLQDSHESISRIIKSIDDIAFKTNILALNAAVEAARAGEAGQGFAVVAEEVRTLAQSSAQAARETSNLITEALQNGEKGCSIALLLEEDLKRIAANSERSFGHVSEIAVSCDQQVKGVQQVTQAIQSVDNVTQQRDGATEVIRDATDTLQNQAKEISNMLQQVDSLMDIRLSR